MRLGIRHFPSVRRSRPLLGAIAVATLILGAVAFSPSSAQLPHQGPSWNTGHGPLEVSEDGRYLQHADGTPFFWLGDTAWELFHRLSREEAARYLEDRRAKGFTVVQAVALGERRGVGTPNAYGHLPLENQNPARPLIREGPRNDYWDHVDWIVEKAAEKGIYVGLLPTWGSYVCGRWDEEAPRLFDPESARAYGEWIGERYRDQPNVIWVVGGDRYPTWCDGMETWRQLAAGIRAADEGAHLMTYHPSGGTPSSEWFHEDDWLDFHMYQSGHSERDIPVYDVIRSVRELDSPKPILNAEPNYEDHPVNWDDAEGWFDAFDVRKIAYWSILAGGFGHTYGAQPIWQMMEPGIEPASPTRHTWREALELVGAWDMLHIRRLWMSRPFHTLAPDSQLIAGGQQPGGRHIQAGRGRTFAALYVPDGRTFEADLSRIPGDAVRSWWYNPRTGTAHRIGRVAGEGARRFDPPGESGDARDWVLVLDDASVRGMPPPGGQAAALEDLR